MTKQEIQRYTDKVRYNLENGKIKNTFDALNFLLMRMQNWQLRENLHDLEENYKRMLDYLINGVQDPQRDKVLNDLMRSLYNVSDSVELELKTDAYSSYYYDRRRSYLYSFQESPDELVKSLEDIGGRLELLLLLEDETNAEVIQLEKDKENIAKKLFDSIWLSSNWHKGAKESWVKVVNNPLMPESLSCLIASAVSLSLLEVFDEQKALFLLEMAESNNEEIRLRVLTGILLFLRKYDKRLYLYSSINNRLQHLAENPTFINEIRNIILQFIISRETEKVSRKIQDELIPKVIKRGSNVNLKIKLDDLMNEGNMDDKNPEWEKIIQDSGLADQFQEISELHMEGVDIMHSSFAHLKSYPFFNDISNWFKPFDVSAEYRSEKDMVGFANLLKQSTMICNSDKYSFFFSISQMPESYRKTMMGQFSAESDAVKEMASAEIVSDSKKIGNVTRQYIQDLYRFFKLYPRKKDFTDIFKTAPEFYEVPSILNLINTKDNLQIVAEYYFEKNYYKEAADLFALLLNVSDAPEVIYQKKGYCHQMLGDIEDAISTYTQAELLNGNNPWVIKKLAYCYRVSKQAEQALVYYKKAEKLNPDNLSIQLNIGHCYLELKDFDNALKYYFKVEYMEADKNKYKAWRPIAWSSFLMGKYEQAMDYFKKVLEHSPSATDYLNMAHTQLVTGNIIEAVKNYHLSIRYFDNSWDKFYEAFVSDIPDLINAGVNEKDIPFILDRVMYEI